MLEHYFVKPSTIDKIRGSWLGSQIESYVEWMEIHGYARPTVLRRVPLLFHFAEFVREKGCTEIASAAAFVEDFVSLWLNQHGAEAKTPESLRKHRIFNESGVLQMLRLACEGRAMRNRHRRQFPLESAVPGFEISGSPPCIPSTGILRFRIRRCWLKRNAWRLFQSNALHLLRPIIWNTKRSRSFSRTCHDEGHLRFDIAPSSCFSITPEHGCRKSLTCGPSMSISMGRCASDCTVRAINGEIVHYGLRPL
jgi:hypothetical protein